MIFFVNEILFKIPDINAFQKHSRPETLDPALIHPGRFDRRVPVELPDLAGREAILNHVQLAKQFLRP